MDMTHNMNILSISKGSTKFTDEQMDVLMDILSNYSKTEDGKWLNNVDYGGLTYKWSPIMEESYVMAACPLIGKSIYVRPDGECPTYWIALVAPAITHELRHMLQKKGNIVKYILYSVLSRIFLCISEDLYCNTLFEKDAFKCQDSMDKFIQTAGYL